MDIDTTFIFGEVEALKASQDVIESGNVSILLINSGLIMGQEGQPFNLVNHWVVLLSVDAAGERNRFKIWSWGSEYDLDLNKDKFESFMWGTVIGYF